MSDKYRVVGHNHHHDGETVEPGTVLSAEDIPDGILDDFPSKFEPVDDDTDAEEEAEAEAETQSDDTEDTSAESEDNDEPDDSDDSEDGGGESYTRAELEEMSRSERVDLAKESDTSDIDGRSSDDDIINALATDEDGD